MAASDPAAKLAWAQGIFYVATGVWPLVSMRTFEAVTGPKVDKWLVKTVGALITVIGGALLVDARKGKVSKATALAGMAGAGVLGAISTNYSLKGRISKVYLLDGMVEFGLFLAWAKLRGYAVDQT